jgi:hypothetical protein
MRLHSFLLMGSAGHVLLLASPPAGVAAGQAPVLVMITAS